MRRFIPLLALALAFWLPLGFAHADDFPVLTGPYLGQEPPGLIPKLFAPFIAPPEDHKHSAPAFSADGTEMYFSVYENYEFPQKIKMMRLVDSVWTAPEVAPFSGQYQEGGPVFSPDGRRLYYYSKRPRAPGGEQREDADVWYVEKTITGWTDPINGDEPINTAESSEYPFGFSPGGNLIFSRMAADRSNLLLEFPIDPTTGLADQSTDRPNEPGLYDGPPLPDGSISMGVCYSEDGNILVVHIYNPDGSAEGLFISQRTTDGTWSELTSMGDIINRGGARFPALSPDRKYLFFLSSLNGPEEVFWVDAIIIDATTIDATIIDELKPEGLD